MQMYASSSNILKSLSIAIGLLLCAGIHLAAADSKARGAKLYAELCADCHGALESTDKPNRPYGRLASAIRVVPSMYHLKRLSSDDLKAITEATTQPDRGR